MRPPPSAFMSFSGGAVWVASRIQTVASGRSEDRFVPERALEIPRKVPVVQVISLIGLISVEVFPCFIRTLFHYLSMGS